MRFSKRYGHQPLREVMQINSIDEALRNSLWSLLKIHYWNTAKHSWNPGLDSCLLSEFSNKQLYTLCNQLWFNLFKKPLDSLPSSWIKVLEQLRTHFFQAQWYEVYDFLEFVATHYPEEYENTNEHFMDACNKTLEKVLSPTWSRACGLG